MADREAVVQCLAGFMARLGDGVEAVQKQMVSASSEEEMFSTLWGLKEAHDTLNLHVTPSSKSEARATALRNQGNAHYHSKELKESLAVYNQSIMYAPHPPLHPDDTAPPPSSLAPPTNVLSRISCSPSPPPPSITSQPFPFRSKSQESREDGSEGHDGVTTPEDTGLDILDEEEINTGDDERRNKDDDDVTNEKDDDERIIPRRGRSKGVATSRAKGGYKALALGYGNRSAVLCELGQYKQSLKDIQAALDLSIPAVSCPKLEARRSRCLRGLEEREARELLLRQHQHNLALADTNTTLPWATNAISLANTPDRGRHHKAITTILPGEVLMVERSYATCLRPDFLPTHCNLCLSRTLTPLPCPTCPYVVFCSSKCQREGLAGAHSAECGMGELLIAMPAPWALACRVLARATVPRLKSWLPALWKELSRGEVEDKKRRADVDIMAEESQGRTREEEEEEAYRRIFKLSTNRENLSGAQLLHSCAAAFTLTKALEEGGGLWVRASGEAYRPSKEESVLVGAALLRHLLALKVNAFNVTETHLTPGGAGPQRNMVGVGIAAGVSLLNHSCRPTAFLTHSGAGSQVLTAARTIASGEEITIDYLVGSRGKSSASRQDTLQDLYGFECQCEACRGEVAALPRAKEDLEHMNDELVLVEASRGVGERDVWRQLAAAMDRYKAVVAGLQLNQQPTREDLEAVCDLIHLLDLHVLQPSTLHATAMLTLEDMASRSYIHVEVKDDFYY